MTVTMKCSTIDDFADLEDRKQASELWRKFYSLIEDRLNAAYCEVAETTNENHKVYLLFADWFADLLENEFGDKDGADVIRYEADEDEDNFQWQNRAF